MFKRVSIFSGNASPALTRRSAGAGVPVGKSKVSRFSDGETFCVIQENVRGVDTYVVQPTCSPVNDSVMELLIMVDALRRASAGSITAVIPYYGYARQDRKVAPRTPITSKLVADLIVAAGRRPHRRGRPARRRRSRASSTSPSTTCSRCRRSSTSTSAQNYGRRRGHRLARRRRRGARARLLQAPRRHAGDHRQAPRARQRERGDEHHRRGRGQELPHPRRHDRHRRHPGERRQRAHEGGRQERRGLRDPRRALGPGGAAHQGVSPLTEVIVTNSIPLSEEAKASGKFKVVSHRPPARRGHPPHPPLGLGQLAVRVVGVSFTARARARTAPSPTAGRPRRAIRRRSR